MPDAAKATRSFPMNGIPPGVAVGAGYARSATRDDASLLASLPAADAGQNVRALTRAVPASSNGPSYRVEAPVGSVPSSV